MKNTFYSIAFMLMAFANYSCTSTGAESTEAENAQFGGIKTLVASDFSAKEKDSNTVVIDVRSPEEVANGFIPGTDLFINFFDGNFQDQLQKLDKTKTYIVYCHSGNRSGKATNVMQQLGFTDIYNLQGGISGWTGALSQK
ncbi:MAG: rhodanese-like domain-containing protein [Flavobacteriales bacterium]